MLKRRLSRLPTLAKTSGPEPLAPAEPHGPQAPGGLAQAQASWLFDIVALYPNLPAWSDGSGVSLYEVVSARIWQFHGGKDHNLASLLDSVLHVFLSSQFVHYEGSVYEACQGLSTGLHAAPMCS